MIGDEMIETTALDRLKDAQFQTIREAQFVLSSVRMEFERFEPGCIPTVAAKLDAWSVAFEKFRKRNAANLTSVAEKRMVAILDLHKEFFEVELDVHSTGDSVDHLQWDVHCDKFEEMLSLAEKATDMSDVPQQLASGPQFHMHTGAVPVIYAIIAKCRDPTIRRRAASLMASRPRLEGVWNSVTVSRLALMIMAVEERGVPSRSCVDIPAESRVRGVRVIQVANNQYMVGYETSRGWCWNQVEKFQSIQ